MDYRDVDSSLAVEFDYAGVEEETCCEGFDDEGFDDEAELAAPADPRAFYVALKNALNLSAAMSQAEA